MESGGKPGKIHITETTHSHLGGKYNLEPAYGEECDEMLQTRNIKVRELRGHLFISSYSDIFHSWISKS